MRFAANVEFTKKGELIIFVDGEVVSAVYLLANYMSSVEYDIFNPNILESEFVKNLPDGHYSAFLCGTLQLEEDIDTEAGTGEPSYIFLADDEDIDIYRLIVDKESRKPYQKKMNTNWKEDKDAATG